MSIPLELAGFTTRTFRYLSSLGAATLHDVLAHGPGTLPRRSATWGDVVCVLARWKARRPELIEPIDVYLAEGGRVRQPSSPTSSLRLEGVEGLVQDQLEAFRRPLPLRQLKEKLAGQQTVDLGERLLAHPDFVVYPYGRSRLVGLRTWNERGYREAAQLSYNLLPLQLAQWHSEERPLAPEVLQAVIDVAQEHHDQHLLRLCRSLMLRTAPAIEKAPDQDVPVPAPEAPAEPAPTVLTPPVPAEETPTPAAEPELALFHGLDPCFDSTRLAMERVLAQAPDRPWSLCEVRPSEGDWLWLQAWARSLKPGNLGWLRSTHHDLSVLGVKRSRQEALGLLLWLLASEEARRHAREGHVWFVMPPLFAPATRQELFIDGQPRPDLRDALEVSALRTNLRSAFGIEGSQAWYLTIFLQFGFTRRGIDNLPYWLSADSCCTHSIALLRESSPPFSALWEGLLRYRRDPARESETRRLLEESSFVLADSVEAILRAAPQAIEAHGSELELLEPPLFAPARLLWPPECQPRFLLSLHAHPPVLVDSGYDLLAGDDFLGRLLRLPGGTYELDPAEVALEPREAELGVTLIGDSLEDRHDFVACLVDPELDVQLFDEETGQRRQPGQVNPSRAVLVLTHAQAELRPPAAACTDLPGLGLRLHLLAAGWSAETELWSEGVSLGSLLTRQVPDWLQSLKLVGTPHTLRLGEEVELAVLGLPPGARLISARFRSRKLVVKADLIRLPLQADLASCRPGLNLVVEKEGRRHRCYCSCLEPLKLLGVTRQAGGEWDIVDRAPLLTVQELSASRFRFFLQGEPSSDWAVLEGDVFSGRPRPQAARLQRPAGYGGALAFGRGPYNRLEAPGVLVKEVVDHGCLVGHTLSDAGLQLQLNRPVHGDSQHLLLAWLQEGWVYTARAHDLELAEGSQWEGDVFPLDATEQPAALGLAYQGRWLGASCPDAFSPDLGKPYEAACLLRWLHLPLAAARWHKPLTALIAAAPLECLKAWVLDRHFEVDGCRLEFSDESVAWLSLVRRLFQAWRPSPAELRQTAEGLGRMDELFLSLVRVEPILAARLGASVCSSSAELALLRRLASQDQSFDELLAQAEWLSQSNAAFIRTLADRILAEREGPLETENYHLMCQLECFTRYMAARCLERMAPAGGRIPA